jgi:hypothetical protein
VDLDREVQPLWSSIVDFGFTTIIGPAESMRIEPRVCPANVRIEPRVCPANVRIEPRIIPSLPSIAWLLAVAMELALADGLVGVIDLVKIERGDVEASG